MPNPFQPVPALDINNPLHSNISGGQPSQPDSGFAGRSVGNGGGANSGAFSIRQNAPGQNSYTISNGGSYGGRAPRAPRGGGGGGGGGRGGRTIGVPGNTGSPGMDLMRGGMSYKDVSDLHDAIWQQARDAQTRMNDPNGSYTREGAAADQAAIDRAKNLNITGYSPRTQAQQRQQGAQGDLEAQRQQDRMDLLNARGAQQQGMADRRDQNTGTFQQRSDEAAKRAQERSDLQGQRDQGAMDRLDQRNQAAQNKPTSNPDAGAVRGANSLANKKAEDAFKADLGNWQYNKDPNKGPAPDANDPKYNPANNLPSGFASSDKGTVRAPNDLPAGEGGSWNKPINPKPGFGSEDETPAFPPSGQDAFPKGKGGGPGGKGPPPDDFPQVKAPWANNAPSLTTMVGGPLGGALDNLGFKPVAVGAAPGLGGGAQPKPQGGGGGGKMTLPPPPKSANVNYSPDPNDGPGFADLTPPSSKPTMPGGGGSAGAGAVSAISPGGASPQPFRPRR